MPGYGISAVVAPTVNVTSADTVPERVSFVDANGSLTQQSATAGVSTAQPGSRTRPNRLAQSPPTACRNPPYPNRTRTDTSPATPSARASFTSSAVPVRPANPRSSTCTRTRDNPLPVAGATPAAPPPPPRAGTDTDTGKPATTAAPRRWPDSSTARSTTAEPADGHTTPADRHTGVADDDTADLFTVDTATDRSDTRALAPPPAANPATGGKTTNKAAHSDATTPTTPSRRQPPPRRTNQEPTTDTSTRATRDLQQPSGRAAL